MQYLVEILKGVCMSFGIIIGFICFGLCLVRLLKSKKSGYEPEDLIKPFEEYLTKIYGDEVYEEIPWVEKIISDLKNGKVSDAVDAYKIKKEATLQLGSDDDDDEETSLGFVTTYTVVGKKDDPKSD